MTRKRKDKKPARGILAKTEAIHAKALKKAAAAAGKKKREKQKPVDLPSDWRATD